ncbi:MAG TPA: Cna B-type domain-containing protein [Lachnospiraceae bacterium]
MKKKRWFGALLSLLMVLSTLFSGTSTMVFAEGTPQTVDATITDFRIEKPKGTEVDHLSKNDSFYLAMDWKVRDENAILHEGDYFDITLPDNMRFPPAYSQPDFDLTDSDGNVIATAHVTHGTENQAGGTIRVTFRDGINDNYNVHGTIYLGALFNKNKTVDNEVNTFEVSVNGETETTQLTVDKVGLSSDYVLGKWGERVSEGGQNVNKVKWYVTINYRKSDMKNCIISDSLNGDTTYLQNSFRLRKVELNDEGGVVRNIEDVELTGKITFGADNKSFTINLGDAGTEQYRLTYETTYTPGTQIKNNVRLQFDGEDKTSSTSYKSSDAGGTAGGDLANKIKITKVDADDNSITLANAVFTVTRPDGSTFELTTGPDGTVTSGVLTQGTYKVKEKTAPSGYELNEEEYTLQVTSSGGALQTIKDEPIKASVKVNKKWIGKEGTSVTVHLYADGEDTGKTLTLTSNNWSGSFDGLRQYTAEGTEIKYTVKEDELTNYSSKTTGSMEDGYTITNTNVEKISIPVAKTWVGKKADSVTVKLLADNNDTGKTLTLNEAGQWKGSFTDLLKYDGTDGHEIAYTIEEVKIDGYNSVISGNAENGFTITNTITGKVSIPVKKTWVGKEGTSATIHLYADGVEVDSIALNTGNSWQYTFTNLEKYKDGKEIKYTIKEDSIENYKSEITGDMTTGFTVKNTNTEKISVPVKKVWVGKESDSVTIKLLADGTEKESVTLTKDDNWAHTFSNLPKYDEDDGHEIVYTLDEVKVKGYNTGISGTADTGFTITNTITGKVSVPVTKTWVGKEGTSATIHLYADGTEVDSVTLNKDNQWQHTFTNLEKYKDGEEIEYTIKEDAIENYKSEITGDMTNGFTVKNTNTETVSVPVTKQWVGKTADKVEVKLLADNVEKETATLTADTDWKHTFSNLPKYDENDGHEIVYTIDEVKVDGYTTGISGTAKDGFTITNTITGKVSVPVTKKWVGTATESITVNLYADGKKIDSQKLSKDNNWQYTFKDLEQYKDGKEIEYTIEEEKVSGYTTTITGDSKNGFVITNTKNTPKTPNTPTKAGTSKTGTPKTGDSTNLPFYGGMMLASLGVLLFLLVRKRKQA